MPTRTENMIISKDELVEMVERKFNVQVKFASLGDDKLVCELGSEK